MLTGLSLPALLEELAAPHEVPGAGSALAVALATAAAAEPPLALARLGADLAELCAAAGARVEPRVHADVAAAAALAEAVARGARELVAVNLTALPGDERVEEADRLVAAAEAAARSI